MSINKYDVLDSEGFLVNTIQWDGKTEWYPPEGHTVVASPSGALLRPEPEIK